MTKRILCIGLSFLLLCCGCIQNTGTQSPNVLHSTKNVIESSSPVVHSQETADSSMNHAIAGLPESWIPEDVEAVERMLSIDYIKPDTAWNATEPNAEGINLHYHINVQDDTTKDVPCPIQPHEAGFWLFIYISNEITAVAYGGTKDTPDITVLISKDMGESWQETKLSVEGYLRENVVSMDQIIHITFASQYIGYLFLTKDLPDHQYLHTLYKTHDSGATWEKISELVNVGGEYLTTYFSTKDIGLMPSYEKDKKVLYHTTDNGKNWQNISH